MSSASGERITTQGTSNLFSVITKRHNRDRPISRGDYEPSRLCKVYDLDLTDPIIKAIPRAGVLFYTFIQGELHICFGRDAKSGDLTDFAGQKRPGESPIKCATREGNEESRHSFSVLRPEQVQSFYCLYSSNMLIILIPVAAPDGQDIREVTNTTFRGKQFLNRNQAKSRAYNEVNNIVWLDEAQFANLFSSRPMIQVFPKVRRFICSFTEFSQNIPQMKRVLHEVIAGEVQRYQPAELELRVQNSLAAIGSEVLRSQQQNKLTQWLSVEESSYEDGRRPSASSYGGTPLRASPEVKSKLSSSSDGVSRRFIPEVRMHY